MCGTHLKDETRKARKTHWCEACSTPIPAGFEYVVSSQAVDGSVSSSKWHVECRDAFCDWLRLEGGDCGDPYSTWEDDMPVDIKKKYLFGPLEYTDIK